MSKSNLPIMFNTNSFLEALEATGVKLADTPGEYQTSSALLGATVDGEFVSLTLSSLDQSVDYASQQQTVQVPVAAPVALSIVESFTSMVLTHSGHGAGPVELELKTVEAVHAQLKRRGLSSLLRVMTGDLSVYLPYLEQVQAQVQRYNKQVVTMQSQENMRALRGLRWLESSGLRFQLNPKSNKVRLLDDLGQVSREDLMLLCIFDLSDPDVGSVLAQRFDLTGKKAPGRDDVLLFDVLNVSDADLVKSVAMFVDSPFEWVVAGKNREERRRRSLRIPPGAPVPALADDVDPDALEGWPLMEWARQNWRDISLEDAAGIVGRLEPSYRITLVRQGGEKQTFWYNAVNHATS